MNKSKKPWPTKAVMSQIYEQHLWGGNQFDFYSGDGSHNTVITEPYLKAVIGFLKSHSKPQTVCDLGCGDFNIGQHLVEYCELYTAIDVVESLIERNKTKFRRSNLEFQCLDITKDEIPIADCAIIRQVLQHLSNSEIQRILEKLTAYNYVILTEHIPSVELIPNKDILSGQGIRLKQHSGVDILKPPFNFKYKNQTTLHEHILNQDKGKIVTILYEL